MEDDKKNKKNRGIRTTQKEREREKKKKKKTSVGAAEGRERRQHKTNYCASARLKK